MPITVVPTTSTPATNSAGVGNGGIVVAATGEVTFTDVVRLADGTPAEGISIDLFKSDADGRRASFVASTETDASGRYLLTAPSGSIATARRANLIPASDCLVAVFIAPEGAYFAETGRFREALVCPTEPDATLPAVQLLSAPQATVAPPSNTNGSMLSRSVLASGGTLYLRGTAVDDSQAALLARRYQWSIGSARVVADYCCSDPGAASPDRAPAGLERVSIDSGLESAFDPRTADLSAEALFVTRQMATVLKWNPTAKLRIVVAIDPAIDEQPTADLLAARQAAVVKGLGNQVAADRLELATLSTVTEGRRLGGRSIDSQLEFVLLWP